MQDITVLACESSRYRRQSQEQCPYLRDTHPQEIQAAMPLPDFRLWEPPSRCRPIPTLAKLLSALFFPFKSSLFLLHLILAKDACEIRDLIR